MTESERSLGPPQGGSDSGRHEADTDLPGGVLQNAADVGGQTSQVPATGTVLPAPDRISDIAAPSGLADGYFFVLLEFLGVALLIGFAAGLSALFAHPLALNPVMWIGIYGLWDYCRGKLRERPFRLRAFLAGHYPTSRQATAAKFGDITIRLTAVALMCWVTWATVVVAKRLARPADGYAVAYHLILWLCSGVSGMLAVKFFMESLTAALSWLPREQRSLDRSAVLESPEPPTRPESLHLTLAHWTDLHVAPPGAELIEGGPSGSMTLGALRRGWSSVRAKLLNEQPLLLVTGDITDTGRARDWRTWTDELLDVNNHLGPIAAVPGNHDVSLVAEPGAWRWLRFLLSSNDMDRVYESLRKLRFLSFMNLYCRPTELKIIHEAPIPWDRSATLYLPDNLERLIQKSTVSADLVRFATDPPRSKRVNLGPGALGSPIIGYLPPPPDVASTAFEDAFPYLTELHGGFCLIGLNSNHASNHTATNAFGRIGSVQLRKLRVMLQKWVADRPFVVAVHHHVFLPVSAANLVDEVQTRAMTLADAPDLLDVLREHPQGGVVFNGHRHVRYHGHVPVEAGRARIVVVSGDTSTGVGRQPGLIASFNVYRLSYSTETRLRVQTATWRDGADAAELAWFDVPAEA